MTTSFLFALVRPGWVLTISKNLLLALAYALLGKTSLLLAIPPGYAMAIYPPAGIALAFVLIGGYRLSPGVALGSFVLNLWIGWDNQHGWNNTAGLLAGLIALGAMAQAAIGAGLFRRFITYPSGLDSNTDILSFVLLCAPLGCLVAASVGIASLFSLGMLGSDEITNNWLTWWIGDTLGVLVLTPVCMILAGEPRQLWRSRRLNVMLPQLFTLVSVIFAFVLVRNWEQRRFNHDFQSKAQSVAAAVEAQLHFFIESQKRVSSLFSNFEPVSREQFDNFVTDFVDGHHALVAIEWLPRVRQEERPAYEKAMRELGYGKLGIMQFDMAKQTVPAGQHEDYFPIKFLAPQQGNPALVGLDLGSNPLRRRLIEKARDSRSPVASEPLELRQGRSGRPDCLLFTAAYAANAAFDSRQGSVTPDQRREAFLGLVLSALDMGEVLKSTLNERDSKDLQIRFADEAIMPDGRVYFDTLKTTKATNSMASFSTRIDFAGRSLLFVASPSSLYLETHKSWAAWAALLGGMLFTGLLGSYFLLVSARSYSFEALVRRRTEELLHSEKRVQAILNNAADGILSVNIDKKIELANLAAGRLLGYAPNDLHGKDLTSIFAGAVSVEFFDQYISHHHSNETQVFQELNGVRADGSLIPLELAIASLRNEGQLLFIVMLHDLTERRRVDNMKGEFVSTVSHELRTPLTSIRGSLGLLLGGALGDMSDKAVKLLKLANDNAERLHTLINDILDFEKLEHGGMQFNMEAHVLSELIRRAVEFNLGYAEKFSVILQLLPSAQLVEAEVDENRLIQVLSNLISNAIKFSHPRGVVEVGMNIDAQGKNARIFIKDQGIGISDEFKERIFSKFSQEDGAAGRKHAGTGLGLSLAKAMIEKMGGSIGFDSVAGQGTTFYLELPLRKRFQDA